MLKEYKEIKTNELYCVFNAVFYAVFGTIQYSEFSIQPKVQPKVLPKVLPNVQQKKLADGNKKIAG